VGKDAGREGEKGGIDRKHLRLDYDLRRFIGRVAHNKLTNKKALAYWESLMGGASYA